MRMLEKINRIRTLISRWVAEIKAHNAEYFYDINKISGNFVLQLLNLIFDYQLHDLNEIKANFLEIKKIYNQDPESERFRTIETLLEREFGDKKGGPSLLRLLSGSWRYYQNLTGPTGRFRHLHIEDLILTRPENRSRTGSTIKEMEWIPQPVTLTGEKTSRETILDVPTRLWDKANKHAVIVGEGGMGKTVSLVRLWQTLLDRCKEGQKEPVPVFIALNEYNQPRPDTDFIVNAICKNYLESTVTAEELWDLLRTPPESIPFLVLLLDGFNEITVDKQELLLEINRLLEQATGVQLILTSRFDMRFHQQWQDFNLLQLQKLEEISDYGYTLEHLISGSSRMRKNIEEELNDNINLINLDVSWASHLFLIGQKVVKTMLMNTSETIGTDGGFMDWASYEANFIKNIFCLNYDISPTGMI